MLVEQTGSGIAQGDVLPSNEKAARTWSAGGEGYDGVSRGIADAIEHAIDRLDPHPGETVLDVATGTGWAARRAAERGARVTGVDFGSEVIAAARRIGPATIDYRVADAESLPFPDAHFDAVMSTFGVMFCTNPDKAAAELLRVCKPGGRIVLATWAPDGGVRQMFQLIQSYKTPAAKPPPSPFEWGKTERLVELLGDGCDLGFEEAISYYRAPDAASVWDTFSTGFGPVVAVRETLDEQTARRFRAEFEAFHEGFRTGAGLLVRREYVITSGRRHLTA
jgi:SAM-dependent methyltransferase